MGVGLLSTVTTDWSMMLRWRDIHCLAAAASPDNEHNRTAVVIIHTSVKKIQP